MPKTVRLKVAPQLTREEVGLLKARAEADLRSTAGYVVDLVNRDLRKHGSRRAVRGASPGDRRTSYEIGLTLTVEQLKRVEARAAQHERSLSN